MRHFCSLYQNGFAQRGLLDIYVAKKYEKNSRILQKGIDNYIGVRYNLIISLTDITASDILGDRCRTQIRRECI